MGNCRSRAALRREDRALDRTTTFVRYAMLGDLQSLKLMLTKDKINPNAQDRFGMTALHWACYTGKLACIQELLRAGALTTVVDQNGRNALHHACRKDQDDVVRFLIQSHHMDVNAASENKDTPLHKAVRGKGVKSIEVLLQHGANPHLRNDQNRTPLEELDSNPGTVTDTVPADISTARVNEALEALRQDFRSDSSLNTAKSKTRASSFSATVFSSRFYGGAGSTTEHASGATLITKFGASIREFSERQSSDLSLSSRTSSAHGLSSGTGGGMWARVTGASISTESTSSSTKSIPSMTPTEIAPLDLASLNAKLNMVLSHTPSPSSSSLSSTRVVPQPVSDGAKEAVAEAKRKSLKYAGKRVIMALRVKNHMRVDEKQDMIRLLLRKHMQRSASSIKKQASGGVTSSQTRPSPLEHKISGLVLSLPPDT